MPVLKYDAYGMGAMKVGAVLKEAGAYRFAAATAEEALELKKLIDKISYRSYKEGIMNAGRQMKYAIETENDETAQWDADIQ